MNSLENEFLDIYKLLSAFCDQAYHSETGVSDYIAEMESTKHYLAYHVPTWDQDLAALKRLRWLRNCIVHEPGPSACRRKDLETLHTFYERFLMQQDPLAILTKHRNNYAARSQMQARARADRTYSTPSTRRIPTAYDRMSEKQKNLIVALVVIVVVAAWVAIFVVRYCL